MPWALDQAMAAYDIDGVYVDNAIPLHCHNQAHGCGQQGLPRYPYFAFREWHKRVYGVVRKNKPARGLVAEHVSRYSMSPALSFVDIYSDGEQFRDPKTLPVRRPLLGSSPCLIQGFGMRNGNYSRYRLCSTAIDAITNTTGSRAARSRSLRDGIWSSSSVTAF